MCVCILPRTALHVNIHFNESLVWFKVSGFLSIVNTGPLLKLISDILLLPRVRVMLQRGSLTRVSFVQAPGCRTPLTSMSATKRLFRLHFCPRSLQAVLLPLHTLFPSSASI